MENVKSAIAENLKEQSLFDALSLLQEKVEVTLKFFQSIDTTNLPLLLRAFKLLKENKEFLDGINDVVKAEYDRMAQSVIPRVFQEMELDSIKMHGRNFILANRSHYSINKDKKDEAFDWLRENDLGMLIKEEVNSKSLSSALKELLEEQAKSPPQDLVNMHSVDYIQVRKA